MINIYLPLFDSFKKYDGNFINLLCHGFEKGFVLQYAETPLCNAVLSNKLKDFLSLYDQAPEEFKTVAVFQAVLFDNVKIFNFLYSHDKGFTVSNRFDKIGKTPFLLALSRKAENVLKKIIAVEDKNNLLTGKDNLNRSAAFYTMRTHNLKFMQEMRKNGVVFDVYAPYDALLPLAGMEKDIKILKWLVEDLRADVNFIDIKGHSALYYACVKNIENNISYLINKGANPTSGSEIALQPLIKSIRKLTAWQKSKASLSVAQTEIKELCKLAKKI